MAQQLWFLRHGVAEPHDARPDPQRRLTPRGERQSREAGLALARLGIDFTAVYTSPRVRALDTARLACDSLGCEPLVHEPLSSEFDAQEALALAASAPEGRLLLVGHEPDFSQVVHDLTGGRIVMRKGGLAGVRLERRRGELIALLRPREIEALAGSGAREAGEPAPAVKP